MPCIQVFTVVEDNLGIRVRGNEFSREDGGRCVCYGDAMPKNLVEVLLGDVRIAINRTKPSAQQGQPTEGYEIQQLKMATNFFRHNRTHFEAAGGFS